MQFYLDAFRALDNRRQSGYASGQPLSVSDILGYAQAHGIKRNLKFFYRVITALDDDYLEVAAKRAKQEAAKNKGKTPNRTRGRRR